MKKAFTFVLALLAAASAWAYDFKAGDLYYNITDEAAKTVEVTYQSFGSSNYSSLPGAVSIPETASYNDTEYSVTSIGYGAFTRCFSLTQVTIPNSVTSIGELAFNQCSSLTHITIPNGIKKIGYAAFAHCTALEQVNIGDGVEYIGCMAFYNTALYNNENNWTSNVLYINDYLIQANTGISGDYTITDGTRVIADEAFMDCVELTGVTIPASVIGIGESSFAGCCNLVVLNVEAVIPPAIASNTFSGVHKNIQLNIPAGSEDLYKADPNWQILFQIMNGKITGTCGDNLTWELIIETGTLTISGTGSMYDYGYDNPPTWSSLYSGYVLIAILTEGIENIGNYAFYYCSALTEITIPESVTSIEYQAFMGCSALTEITIPESMESIGDRAFFYCSALTEITVLATVPPTVGADAFYNVSRSIPVYVPAESLEDYQAAETWNEFDLHAMPATDLQTPSMPESISVYGGMLHNPQQLPVSLYDMQGRMVYSGTAATVSQPAGVYVLRCAGASGKVLF